MKKLYYLTFISVVLAMLAVWAVATNPFQSLANQQPLPDWTPPYKHFVSGQGVITPAPNLIPLRPAESGQVVKTFVKVGDTVKQGQPLLQLNIQDLLADKLQLQATLSTALAEEKSSQNDYSYYRQIYHKDGGKFISKQDFTRAKNLLNIAHKKVSEKQTALQALQIRINRRTLKASFTGQLIRFSVYPGMWLRTDETPPDEIVIAPNRPLQLIVELNQFDIIHFSKTAPAIAWLPNRPKQKISLQFNHIELIVQAKTLTSGRSTELTDTRVITLVYDIMPTQLPLYTGEQFDVFIKAKP